jgi:hypothetical protein
MLAKKKKLLVLDVKGLLMATYHKHEALPLEPHHVKFDNFYIKILLLLFFFHRGCFFGGRICAFGLFTVTSCFLLWLSSS